MKSAVLEKLDYMCSIVCKECDRKENLPENGSRSDPSATGVTQACQPRCSGFEHVVYVWFVQFNLEHDTDQGSLCLKNFGAP